MLLAHSENDKNRVHPLIEHLEKVSKLAYGFAGKFSAAELGKYAGLWHDLGKAHPGFQRYLQTNGKSKGQDHKGAGAELAWKHLQLLTFLIAGHHGGLSDPSDLKAWVGQKCHNDSTAVALKAITPEVEESLKPERLSLPSFLNSEDAKEVEFFLRLLFSALVDADFLDTESHFNRSNTELRGVKSDFNSLWEKFHRNQESLIQGTKQTPVNRIRNSVYKDCIASATKSQGVYRLTVPTGGGKTRSGLGFVLKHARTHNLDRIIICLPFTSIIEQNAQVYRDILGNDPVLEHHSSIQWKDPENYPDPAQAALRLANENWDAPVIVTTTVQFFESLFSNKTSRCRKLHNIVNSCIILDEVQALPSHLLSTIVDGLKQLINNYNCTVVLSTATQPSLEKNPAFSGFAKIQEIISDPEKLFSDLQRVEYQNYAREEWSDIQLVQQLKDKTQVLCVVNTRKDAQRIWYLWDDPGVYHLSSSMCSAHRSDTLREIREKLDNREPCRVISTQVIEAGVDIDFPVVYRAVAPLDSIVQSAGRCNREGSQDTGTVVVFELEEGGLPQGAYRTGTDISQQFLRDETLDLNSPDTFPAYFRKLYQSITLDPRKIEEDRKNLRFKTVAEKFKMISDDTETVLVEFEKNFVQKQIQNLKNRSVPPRIVLRNIQPYTVSVSQWQHSQMVKNSLVQEVYPGIWITQAKYHYRLGLLTDKKEPSIGIL